MWRPTRGQRSGVNFYPDILWRGFWLLELLSQLALLWGHLIKMWSTSMPTGPSVTKAEADCATESMLTWVKVTHQITCIFLMIQAGLHFFNINCLSPRKHYVLCLVIFILIFLSQKKGKGREFLVIVTFIRFFWIEVSVGWGGEGEKGYLHQWLMF